MARKGAVPYLLGTRFYRMAFVEFGNPAAEAVICVHGLTRNGRDFDPLAERLAERYHVICPDLPGRGASEWLGDAALYQPPSYVAALTHLLAWLNKPVAWIGTSLGGICGMMAAAARNAPVTKLVLNDVGPLIPAAALMRIRDYLGSGPTQFPSLKALETHLRAIHAPFGALTDAQWAHLARYSARPVLGGEVALHYDPAIAEPIRASTPQDVDLGAVYGAISARVLAIRGAESDLLLPETLEAMAAQGAETLIVEGAGHAPALMDEASMRAIERFLAG